MFTFAPSGSSFGHPPFVPAGHLEPARALGPGPDERLAESCGGVQEDAVVGQRALAAQLAATDRMLRVAAHVDDTPVRYADERAAGVVAVTRTGGANVMSLVRHRFF